MYFMVKLPAFSGTIICTRYGTNYDNRLSNRMSEQKTTDDDAELVALSQKGDLGAFEQLVKKHQKKMFNLAFRIAGRPRRRVRDRAGRLCGRLPEHQEISRGFALYDLAHHDHHQSGTEPAEAGADAPAP